MAERGEQDRAAVCTDIIGLLPAYLNRSLEADEARRVEAHLVTCAVCRREERDTRTAWALYEGHLPVELLLDYALEEPLPSRRLAVVESHLAVCERCSGEVATVRQQPTAAELTVFEHRGLRRPGAATPTAQGLRILAWAACLATVVAAAGWIWTWRQWVDERALSSALTARTNLSVVELLPATQTLLRHGSTDPRAAANRVEMPADAEELVLVLLSGGRSCQSGCILEIFEPGEERPQRRVEGLVPSPDGHVTLALPGDWIPPERAVLAVRDRASGELVAEYLVEIRQPAAGRR